MFAAAGLPAGQNPAYRAAPASSVFFQAVADGFRRDIGDWQLERRELETSATWVTAELQSWRMPWLATTPMDERVKFIAEALHVSPPIN